MNLKRLMNQCIRRDLFYFPKRLPSTETLGTVYGGHSVLTSVVDKAPVLYSFGVGEDISFDLAMMQRFDAQVFACDPTPRAVNFIEGQELSSSFQFKAVAVSDKNETLEFHPPANPAHVSHSAVQQHTAQEPLKVQAESVATHAWMGASRNLFLKWTSRVRSTACCGYDANRHQAPTDLGRVPSLF